MSDGDPVAAALAPVELERPQRAARDELVVRVRAFFADPVGSVERLGRTGDTGDETLRLLDEIGRRTRALGELNRDLLPLIERFTARSRPQRWWSRFTGEALERELSFGRLCERIKVAACAGTDRAAEIRATVDALDADRLRIDAELATLQAALELGHAVLDPAREPLRRACRAPEDTWARLSRRLGNLEAMATALALTRTQYGVAIDAGRAMVDRFEEIRLVLIPLWRQHMGFELFARQAAPAPTSTRRESPLPASRSPA